MRPLAGEETHEVHELGAGRQHLPGGLPGQRAEARLDGRIPGLPRVDGPGEVRHEEEIEVGEVVRQVLAGEDQVGGQLPVGRHGEPWASARA